MTNIERAEDTIERAMGEIALGYPGKPQEIAEALADAGHLTPAPQIIRTREELEALDPDTLLTSPYDETLWAVLEWVDWVHDAKISPESTFPLVVVASVAQVRAARTALQESTND